MPFTINNLLRTMLCTTTNCKSSTINRYTYVDEDKISRSLMCPICLDPLVDPRMHILCRNSFCSSCIKKLKRCPCCQSSNFNSEQLGMTSHALRNVLDELQV